MNLNLSASSLRGERRANPAGIPLSGLPAEPDRIGKFSITLAGMIYLNLQTRFLRAPEYVGSEPASRAAWLNILAYSCEQENGGVIRGSKTWKDRQWQQTCGVTLQEISDAAPLLEWDGDDLIVWQYPLEKESEVKSNRERGRAGGSAKTIAKSEAAKANGAKGGRPNDLHNPSGNPSGNTEITQAETQAKPENNPTEGKGRESKGKESTLAPTDPAKPSWSEPDGWFGISENLKAEWKTAFPACDIGRQLAAMSAWLKANPSKRKSNYGRFIVNWLRVEQDRGGDMSSRRNDAPAKPAQTFRMVDL